ncbi:TPA: hypothetical protein N0F65_010061 [Lagenidium giganteum]|uniref:Dynein regulatory complex subunit 7 n=1 Tax=Lagenidium giganteum TaxID=4803 RepID=A0AAV2ZEY6_9STRA|nr:TPA: hypothetical protein N0F65_010061 [Lagenidium giganteum]
MVLLDMKADAKDGEPQSEVGQRQDIFNRTDEEVAIAARQFTTAGVVSTKQRRLEDDLVKTNVPESYTSNTNKELLCLEYVSGFQRQFEQMFPHRKPLYLFPPNEKGIPKFVCSTIRPTLLPYRDLYDHQQLARFLAGVIEYEPLADPVSPPKCLPSPSFVLRWHAGDCFDLSVLLVSFLVGAGYDAYVAYGIAPRWICLMDQSNTPIPTLPVEEAAKKAREVEQMNNKANAEANEKGIANIKLESRSAFRSKYLDMQQERLLKEKQDRERKFLLDTFYDEEEEDDDILEGKRVHAWVLIRAGKREVADHFFIEPTTGRTYSLKDSPYQVVEAVWNHENYWVNMQTQTLQTTLFDLTNSTDWEYVFLSNATERRSAREGAEDSKGGMDLSDDLKSLSISDGSNQHEDDEEEELILDIPPSWVTKLHIDRTMFKKKFVTDCQRVTLYRRAKVEEFAEYMHDQGLIMRVTMYRDNGCSLPIEIREYFKNRKDKLEMRKRLPLENKFEEHFAPGRLPEALKARIEWLGYRREFHFYTSARMDGLVRREEDIQKRTMEFYDGRDDYLIFRSVTLTSDKDEIDSKNPYVLPGGPTGELAIKKMTEKFARNPSVDANDDPRKKTYNVQEGNIRVNFHYATGKITAGSRVYHKAPNMPVEVVMTDPNAQKPKNSILEEELRATLQMEKDCYSSVRDSEIETQDILKIRKREEMTIVLETNFFDGHEDDSKGNKKDESKDHGRDAKNEMDYLTPFLQSIHYNGGDLTKDEAHSVREMCLRNLKERLLERANIIQTRLDRENALLAKRQAAFQRSQREHDQGTDEEFERFCSETMFRIQILEQRLASHEETALQKYAEMDQRLHNDARLRILHR